MYNQIQSSWPTHTKISGIPRSRQDPEIIPNRVANIVRKFAERCHSSLLCDKSSCTRRSQLPRLKEHQLRILERILSETLRGPFTGYVRCIPGSDISVVEVLIPHLFTFAGLGGGLFVIITPRLMSLMKIAKEASLLLPYGTSISTCSGIHECGKIENLLKRRRDTQLLIITYQMLVNLYKNKKNVFSMLAKQSKTIILDYPDVNGIGSTTAGVLEKLKSMNNGAMIAFLAWGNKKVERLLDKEIARIRMKEVSHFFTQTTVFIQETNRTCNPCSPANIAGTVDKYLKALKQGGIPLYQTVLIVTDSNKRAKGIAASLRSRGYDVVVISSNISSSRILANEAKSQRRIIVETGSLVAGYDHRDVDVLFLDTYVGISRYAVYRGIVSRRSNSISRLKASYGVSLIVDLTGKNIKNEYEFKEKHALNISFQKISDRGEIFTLLQGLKSNLLIVTHNRKAKGNKRVSPSVSWNTVPCISINDAIGKIMLKEGIAVKACKFIEVVRIGEHIRVYYVKGSRRKKLGNVRLAGFEGFEEILRKVISYVNRYCHCIT